jgi:hypothetical protein
LPLTADNQKPVFFSIMLPHLPHTTQYYQLFDITLAIARKEGKIIVYIPIFKKKPQTASSLLGKVSIFEFSEDKIN